MDICASTAKDGSDDSVASATRDKAFDIKGGVNRKDSSNQGLRKTADSKDEQSGHEDLTLLEYARSYGLAQDYMSFDPLDPAILMTYLPKPEPVEHNLPFLDPVPGFREDEKFSLDRPGALFLQTAIVTDDTCDEDAYEGCPQDHRLLRRELKIESPLLASDPGLDLSRFVRQSKSNNETLLLESETLFAEGSEDADLEWLDPQLPALKDAEASSEKLQLTHEDILFLQAISPHALSVADEHHNDVDGIATSCTFKAEYKTPPLLPLSPPWTASVPVSPVGRLQPLSSPADPSVNDLRALEDDMMKDDAASLDGNEEGFLAGIEQSDSSDQMHHPPNLLPDHGSSPSTKRKHADDYRVEVPLLPEQQQSSPFKKTKTVAFREVLCTTIPDFAPPFSSEDLEEKEAQHDKFFREVIEPEAANVVHEVEHEQLCEADSTSRVEVPHVSWSTITMPWEQFARKFATEDNTLSAQGRMLRSVKLGLLNKEPGWPGSRQLSNEVSTWVPFPSDLGRVAAEEAFDDGPLVEYLSQLSFEEPSASTWKPEGLRILDDHEDEADELDNGDLDPDLVTLQAVPNDMQSLIRKHHFKLEEATGRLSASIADVSQPIARHSASSGLEIDTPPGAYTAGCQRLKPPAIEIGNPSIFSATNALQRFMQMHTGSVVSSEPSAAAPGAPETVSKSQKLSSLIPEQPARAPAESATIHPIPIPTTPIETTPEQFILSSNMLEQRGLLRGIKILRPTAEFIERDFAQPAYHNAGPIVACCEEADLLLSPGTGLVLTTLQKLKQKPLPGQARHDGFLGRVKKLALRYERVLILVSESHSTASETATCDAGARALDDNDCRAMSSFVSMATALDADVQVTHVPGGITELAAWIAALMARYGVRPPRHKLVQDETYWELFLRKAGMNAFAAQAVLGVLKAPATAAVETCAATSRHGYGLAAFVCMQHDERLRMFGNLIGGTRVLERVGRAVDGRWGRLPLC